MTYTVSSGTLNPTQLNSCISTLCASKALKRLLFSVLSTCVCVTVCVSHLLLYLCTSLDGVPACANKRLLKEILRDSWNFSGYVVSDDDALEFMISFHHYVSDTTSAAAAALKAGCNLELTDITSAGSRVFGSIPQV